MTADERFMHRALALARRAEGRTSPNPMVGCVVVKKGRVVAEGWHRHCGGDHAEVEALKQAGDKARGAVMYVTLEPCAHWGRTPPCVDAVLKAGIGKVVVAMQDPDPRTNGVSLKKLRKNGVLVVTGVCAPEAGRMNAAFIKYITAKMPHVTVKIAQTIDGKAGTRSGRVKWITAGATRLRARLRRNDFDAIVVGVDTVLADDPRLDAPGKSLVKVIVDSTLRTPPGARLLKGTVPGQVVAAVTRRAPDVRVTAFRARGACVMVCGARAGKVDLKALFKALAKNGLIRILIEGGPTLVNAALHDGLVDRIHAYIAPRLMRAAPADAVAGVDLGKLLGQNGFQISAVERMGQDIFIEADRVNPGG